MRKLTAANKLVGIPQDGNCFTILPAHHVIEWTPIAGDSLAILNAMLARP